jgi:hypothetical protein
MTESQGVDSPIPQALLRSPRIVRRKPGTFGPLLFGRILTAPVLAAFAVLLGVVVLEPIIVFLFPARPARVVGQWREFKGRRGTEYYIEYQFDRSGFTGRDEVLPDEYQAFQVGQAVKAHVIHLGPMGYSMLDRSLRAYARYRMILWFGALFALAIGGVLFYAIWLLPWRSHWLTRHGEATFGAVVEKSIVHGRRRHLYFTLTYQFRAQRTLRARRIRISSQRYDSADVKDLVIILFDPARPSRNIVYDYCDFIAS